jgi:hypothetical protein
MARVYTADDIEGLAREGAKRLVVADGELISPAAVDLAASRGIEVARGGAPAEHGSGGAHADGEACACHAEEVVEASVRSVIRSVAEANPTADASTVAAEALRALGAHGGASIGSVEQAQPLQGRALPSKAKGARPVFFDDGGATDGVIAIVTALASELWAVRERLDSLERVLAAKGTIAPDAVEGYRPDSAGADERAAEAAAYVSRVFRVFEQMREETAADETWDGYMEVVRRAFAEL